MKKFSLVVIALLVCAAVAEARGCRGGGRFRGRQGGCAVSHGPVFSQSSAVAGGCAGGSCGVR